MKQLMFKGFNNKTLQINQVFLQRPQSLLQTSQHFTYKTVVRRIKNEDFINERKEYNEKMKEMRKKHWKDYWQTQTQAENNYLETWRKEQLERQRRDLDRWRTSICKISMHTKKQMQDLDKREERLMRVMQKQDLYDTKKAMENKIMLDVMQIESKKWPTLFDLNSKIDENVVIPQTILNYGEYQNKLQQLAFYAEQGDHESMQKLLDKEEVMEQKNVLLQPLFRDLKTTIKHMTYTEEYKIIKEYIDNRNLILNNHSEESEKAKEGIKLLEQEYARLLTNYKKSLQDPTKKLKTLQKRLEDIFQLLSLWSQYVEIIYMPESEIHVLSAISKMDARPEDQQYAMKAQARDIENRLNILFGTKSEESKQEEDDTPSLFGKDKDGYETVNEGLTSDTTEAPSQQAKRQKTATTDEEIGGEVKTSQKKGEVEEGILSSDEEQQEQAARKGEEQENDITKFNAKEKKGAKLYGGEKAREDTQIKYNYGEQDIEQFGAKLQTIAERDTSRSYQGVDAAEQDFQDKQFVEQTKYSGADIDQMDMGNLNLFGVPMEETDTTAKDEITSAETKQILRDLIDLTEATDKSINNFQIKKSFTYYDPYEPEESVELAYLKFEDQLKLRASIVLDHYKQDLLSMKDEDLTFADQERKKQVLKLLDFTTNLKIIDAKVLMKLYNLYRYKV